MSTVFEWMTKYPICIGEGTPLGQAAAEMTGNNIRHLPVVDARGKLVGGVTDFAIFGRGMLVGHDAHMWFPFLPEEFDTVVDDVMEPVELVFHAEDELAVALLRLSRAAQDFGVVVDGESRPVGILTEHDPVKWTAELLEEDRHAALDASVPVATVALEDDLLDVHQDMVERGVRHLVVVDRAGRAEAVLSYRDVVTARGELDEDSTVADAVGSFVLHALPMRRATTAQCARIMADRRIGCVPLLGDDRRPLGIVTRRDLCEVAAYALEADALVALV